MCKIQNFTMLVLMLLVANAWGADFFDDFDRPNGDVGNDWQIQTDGTITVQIVDNEVLIAGEQATDWARSGLSRTVQDVTKIAFDFKADDNFNVHVRLDDVATGAYIDVYAWPGGPFSYASSEDGGWPGWVAIDGSNMIAGEYNILMLEQEGTEFTVTLNGVVVGAITNGNLPNIGRVALSSDAAAGTVGSIHIDNVSLFGGGPPPAVHPTTGEPLVVDCLRGAPEAIDGDLSDWNLEALIPAVLDMPEQLFTGQDSWTGPEDCSGEFYVMWDDVNIYMAVIVKDDKLSMNKTGGDIWNADAVEIFFATTNAVAGHAEHYQYGFNANNQRWNWCNMDGAGSTEPDYLQIASAVTADGYICEASISYAQMPSLDWSVGNAIGLHPVLDDTDNGDRELQMTWTGREAHDQSLGYGHMILSADSVPELEDSNPIGWWPLNEGSGDIAFDLSSRGNDGTIQRADSGGLGADGSVWFMDPDHGMVASFNGDDSTGAYIATDLIIPALGLTDDFTWAFWAKQHADQATNNDTILGNRYGGTQSPLQFCKFTPTRFEFYNDDGNYEQGINYDPVPSDVWVHHAVTKDGADLTYYRNGEVAMTNTLTKTMDENPFYMGGDAQPAELWKGYLSDVRLYNRALTKLEILAAMKGVERIDMEVGFALQPPVIDGEVDYVWEGASTESFVPLEDPADGSGTWKVLYDAENLYVIVDVTDDSLQNDSADSWLDDSVEIYFDGGNTKLSTPLSGDDHQYTFGWTTDEIQGNNFAGYIEGIEQAQVTTETGWRIEVKMPWMSIWGVVPEAGDLIGIDCYYNDDDDGGDSREGKMLSISTVEGWNDASQWGTAILATIPEPVDPGTDGLAAYYALDNDVLDSSGNGNDGIITDNPDFVDPTWIDGVVGGALEIHGDTSVYGSADHVQVPHSDSLDIAGPISIALWIRPDADDPEGKGSPGGETAPMAKALSGMSPSWSYQVRYGWGGPSPYMSFTFNTSPRAWASVGQNLTQGEWCHIACSHDGTTLKCYLDGVETDSTPMGQITSSPAPVLIGSDGWGCDWIGAIDEVAIYDRGLSVGEIRYLAGERVPLYVEDFESYTAGDSLHGVGGWAGWAGDAAASAPVSDAFAYSGVNSVEIIGSADLVQEFDVAGGQWEFSAMQYIPSGTTGTTYFILMNQYGATNDWSVQTSFNMETGAINYWHTNVTATIVYDEWIELKYAVDLDNNTVDKYYNGEFIVTDTWDDGNSGMLGAVDLFGNGASSVYYDDIMLK